MSVRCPGCMKEYDEEAVRCPFCGYIRNTGVTYGNHLPTGVSLAAGRYTVGRQIGSGGFGITYIAWDNTLERTVAVKEYFPSEFAMRETGKLSVAFFNAESREQFENGRRKLIDESVRLARLEKLECVVKVYDRFDENNTSYIIMEYLEGETLSAYIKREKTVSFRQAAELLRPVLEVLCAVHEIGIIHRDIAPDNIFLCSDGAVKLLDFGSARYATRTDEKSISIVVKRGYAPIEQYTQKLKQGTWTDVYAMCATLYRMVTGEVPEEATSRQPDDLLKLPSELVAISPDAESLIMHGLAVNRADRLQTVGELMTQIDAALASEPKKKTDKEAKDGGKKTARIFMGLTRRTRTIAAICAGVVVLGVATAVIVKLVRDDDDIPEISEASIEKVAAASVKVLRDLGSDSFNRCSFVDLDMDGVCELLVDSYSASQEDSGTMVYSFNGTEMNAAGLYGIGTLSLFYDYESDSTIYTVTVTSDDEAGGSGVTMSKLIFSNGSTVQLDIAHAGYLPDPDGESGGYVAACTVGTDSTPVTEETYYTTCYDFFKTKLDLHMSRSFCSADDLELSDSALCDMLVKAYKSFSYNKKYLDGYSAADSWIQQYMLTLTNEYTEALIVSPYNTLHWCLYDWDSDGTPELFFGEQKSPASPVFGLRDGKARELGSICADSIYFYADDSGELLLVGINSASEKSETLNVYKLSGSSVELSESFSVTYSEEEGDSVASRNGLEIDVTEYEQNCEKYTTGTIPATYYGYSSVMTETGVVNYIRDFTEKSVYSDGDIGLTATMPDLTGLTLEAAQASLKKVGLALSEELLEVPADRSDGEIIFQSIAAEETIEKGATIFVAVSKSTPDSSLTASGGISGHGDFGNSVSWTLYANGLLTVTGSGRTRDYGLLALTNRYYHNYKDSARKIYVADGITYIGTTVIADSGDVSCVRLPSSLRTIGTGAFSNFGSLGSLIVPSGVTSIGSNAFSGCSSLSTVVIPDSVTSMSYCGIGSATTIYCFEGSAAEAYADSNGNEKVLIGKIAE